MTAHVKPASLCLYRNPSPLMSLYTCSQLLDKRPYLPVCCQVQQPWSSASNHISRQGETQKQKPSPLTSQPLAHSPKEQSSVVLELPSSLYSSRKENLLLPPNKYISNAHKYLFIYYYLYQIHSDKFWIGEERHKSSFLPQFLVFF